LGNELSPNFVRHEGEQTPILHRLLNGLERALGPGLLADQALPTLLMVALLDFLVSLLVSLLLPFLLWCGVGHDLLLLCGFSPLFGNRV
jgi:hypothetical protein